MKLRFHRQFLVSRWKANCFRQSTSILLVMKVTSLLLLTACLQASATGFGQNITLHVKDASLTKVFREITRQSGYQVFSNDRLLKNRGKITANIQDASLKAALDACLKDLALSYVIVGKTVVIKQMEEVSAELSPAMVPIIVKGIITDEKGSPLPGASIRVKGKNKAVASDGQGAFTLTVEPGDQLLVSFVGYEEQVIAVDGRREINISMKLSASKVDEIIVVGYGKQSKQTLTSSITTVKTDNFKNAPYTDIQSALAGRAAGVVVNFSGGEPGSVPSMTIRGGEPLIGQSTPLYVIDGIIRDQNAFVALNMNDIESVSFLKDAAATAVYGAKASAGIVQVTTKSGQTGKPRFSYSNNTAWNTPSLFPKLINSTDKALVANAIGEAAGNGKNSVYTPEQLDKIKNGTDPDTYPNTDWYGLSFRKYARQQNHNLSVSGGTKETKYYAGLGYFEQGSNYVNNSFRVQRFSYNTKLSTTFDATGLTIALGLNGYYTYSTQPPAGSGTIFSHIVAKSPLEQAYNKDGSLAPLVDHPLAEINSPGYSRSETFFNDGNLTFTWNVPWVKGLTLKALGDYVFSSNPGKTFNVLATQYNADGTIYPTPSPTLTQANSNSRAYNVEFQADYNTNFGEHTLGATLVSVTRGGNNKWFSAQRKNFVSTAVDQMFAGDAATQVNDGSASEWGEVGYVGRIKYDYAKKYLLEFAGRYDGSDYFPPSKRFGFFPSVSAGWIISKEQFYENAHLDNVFSYFKLRGSYGKVGSIGGTKYAYLPQYGVHTQTYVANGNLQNGYFEGGLTVGNQNITWFSTRSRDFGIEFESLKKKLSGNIDYFYTRTTNILGSPAYRYTDPLGQSLPQVLTDAATRKEGIDASLNYNFNINTNLKGYVGVNVTYFNYLWERTNEDSASLTNPYTRSQGVNQDYSGAMYSSHGLYQNFDDILNNPSRLTSSALGLGDVWLEDTNGDGKIDAQDFRRLGKSSSPRFTFGIPFGLEYKGLRFDALIQGSGTRNVYLGGYLQGGEGLNRINFDFQKNYWLADNKSADFPRAGNSSMNSGNNYSSNTFWLKDARFVRLKSVTLSYNFRQLLRKTSPFTELSAFASGNNLLTFSPVKKYFDPELADNNNFFYPVNKTYSVGIRVGF